MKGFNAAIALLTCLLIGSCDSRVEKGLDPDVVFVTTPHKVAREMLRLAGVTQHDVVYDLGSGDGRIVIAAARDFGARGVGIEIDPKLVAESNARAKEAGVSDRVAFMEQDVLKADISRATVIALYMLPALNRQLLPRFMSELRPGTRVVSHRFGIGDWKPDMTLSAFDTTIYLWAVPADVHGEWRVSLRNEKEAREYVLALQQKYQEIQGSVSDGTTRHAVTGADLQGREIFISVADAVGGQRFLLELEGLVKGDVLEGAASITDFRHPLPARFTWRAVRASTEHKQNKKQGGGGNQ
jgi:SAM-dependent methyltransferase